MRVGTGTDLDGVGERVMVVCKSMIAGSRGVDCLVVVLRAAAVVAREAVGSCDTPSIMHVVFLI